MPCTRSFVCVALSVVASSAVLSPSEAATISVSSGDAEGLISALNRAGAGDVVEVAAGVYKPTRPLWIGQEGRADAHVVLRAASGTRPVLDGSAMPSDAAIVGVGGKHVTIQGLEFRAAKQQCITVWGGAHVRIADNVIHDCHQGGVFVGYSRRGVTTDVHIEGNRVFNTSLANKARTASGGWSGAIAAQRAGKVTVKGNTVFENYGEGILFNLTDDSTAVGNTVHDNFSVELYLDNAKGCRFIDNVVSNTGKSDYFHNRGGWRPAAGIQMANETYSDSLPLDDNRVEGNVVINTGWGFYYGAYQNGGGIKNTIVAHNTFYGAAVTVLHVDADAGHANTTFANNLFVQTNGGAMTRIEGGTGGLRFVSNGWHGGSAGAAGGSGDVTGDPKFKNAGGRSAADYDLTSGSAYLKGATSLTSITSRSFIGARGAVGAAPPATMTPSPTTPASPAMPTNPTPQPPSPSPTQPATPSQPPAAPGATPGETPATRSGGLFATYFSDETLTTVALSRVDATVDFTWGSGAPSSELPSDGFSVRWTGAITPASSGKYKLGTTSDDGVRLWVDRELVIDNWTLHAATDDVVEIDLVADRAHDIRLEVYERGGQATAKLWWVPPGQQREIVPADRLSHAATSSSVLTFPNGESAGPERNADSNDPVRGSVGCAFAKPSTSGSTFFAIVALWTALVFRRRARRP